jgi:hypothetical protein
MRGRSWRWRFLRGGEKAVGGFCGLMGGVDAVVFAGYWGA